MVQFWEDVRNGMPVCIHFLFIARIKKGKKNNYKNSLQQGNDHYLEVARAAANNWGKGPWFGKKGGGGGGSR